MPFLDLAGFDRRSRLWIHISILQPVVNHLLSLTKPVAVSYLLHITLECLETLLCIASVAC